jgi:hypothetical protein
MTRRHARDGSPALYLTDDQLWPLISPQLSRAAFIKSLSILETRGLPRVDPVFKGRYWPAVRAWLDHRAGIGDKQVMAIDGEETWDDEAQRFSGAHNAQARRLGKKILERGKPHGQGAGVSRSVDPFTARRHRS